MMTRYTPHERYGAGSFRIWKGMFRNVIDNGYLILQLFKRDLVARYKRSFFGCAWLVIIPVFETAIWVFLRWTDVLKPGEMEIPYTAYVFAGMCMWSLFTGFYNAGSATLNAGRDMLLNVSYPHEIVFIEQALLFLATFTIRFILTIVVLLLFGVVPGIGIILLPLVALPLIMLGSALGLLISLVGTVAEGARTIGQFGLNILMLATPLVYSGKTGNPALSQVLKWNPLTYLVCSCREIVLNNRLYGVKGYVVCSIGALGLFLFALRLFHVSEKRLVERIY